MARKSDADNNYDGLILPQVEEEKPQPKSRGLDEEPPGDDNSPGGG